MSFQRLPSNSSPPRKSVRSSTVPPPGPLQNQGTRRGGAGRPAPCRGPCPRRRWASSAGRRRRRGRRGRARRRGRGGGWGGRRRCCRASSRRAARRGASSGRTGRRGLAFEDAFELLAEIEGGGEAAVGAFLPVAPVGLLAGDPVADIAVRQRFERGGRRRRGRRAGGSRPARRSHRDARPGRARRTVSGGSGGSAR